MRISVGELHAVRADLARGTLMSLQGAAAEELPDILADHAPGPESMLLHREQLGYLHDAIDALPDRLRTVVEAVYFQNRPVERGRRGAVGDPVPGLADVRRGRLPAARRDQLPAGPGGAAAAGPDRPRGRDPERVLRGSGLPEHRRRTPGDVEPARGHPAAQPSARITSTPPASPDSRPPSAPLVRPPDAAGTCRRRSARGRPSPPAPDRHLPDTLARRARAGARRRHPADALPPGRHLRRRTPFTRRLSARR